jgi:hypothetical protein
VDPRVRHAAEGVVKPGDVLVRPVVAVALGIAAAGALGAGGIMSQVMTINYL